MNRNARGAAPAGRHGRTLRRPGGSAAKAAGVSLLEMLLVVALIAAMSLLAAAAFGGGMAGLQLRSSAKEIAANLRYTRALAISTGEPQRFTIDPVAHAWTAPNGRDGEIPRGCRWSSPVRASCSRARARARSCSSPTAPPVADGSALPWTMRPGTSTSPG